VVVTASETDLYQKRGLPADAFESIAGTPGMARIRKRDDGACVFLSDANRCRIHEELGAAKKPLTCRLYPYAFHQAADAVVVTASFGCPTIVANEGTPVSNASQELESLRQEWFAIHPSQAPPLELVKGRSLDTRSLFLLRQNLMAMLMRDGNDLRAGVRRMAAVLDDLTRSRVVSLGDSDFAEYLKLTVPHAAAKTDAPPSKDAGAIARLLQYGFLYTVAAIRSGIEHPGRSRWRLRLMRLKLMAHFHRLAPGVDRVNVSALRARRVDLNDGEIRPIAFHYLRSTLETLGASGMPVVDELSIAASYLNATCALAVMNAAAATTTVDRGIFITALTEASDVSHARSGLLDWVLKRFGGTTEALWQLATEL